jgi:hypothetical protein
MAPSTTTEIPVPPPKELSNFQLRRRRAAKLTNFFGVDYRELIHDILESIEKGVEEERKRGTLRPEEVEVSSITFSLRSFTHDFLSLCCISFTIFGQDRMGFYNDQYYSTLLPVSTFMSLCHDLLHMIFLQFEPQRSSCGPDNERQVYE